MTSGGGEWTLAQSGPLRGEVRVPGDKSISHRALLLGGLAHGATRITGLLRAEDVASTARCLAALGVRMAEDGGSTLVLGRGGELAEPADVLDCGNSGTTMRLLCGILAGQPMFAALTGDASLRRRPMARVADPLRAMGARIDGREGGDLAPIAIRGGRLRNGPAASPVASAQVKSALLLAGLRGEGTLSVTEPHPSRDHTERMLAARGVTLQREGDTVRLDGGQAIEAVDVQVPGDFSSAAFLLVAASIVPGSDVTLRGVGLNPTRTGLLDALLRMGADIEILGQGDAGGEPVGDLRVRAAELRGITLDEPDIPRLIDEVPVLAVAAAVAEGETRIRGAGELRVKESDRIATTAAMLRALGAGFETSAEGMIIQGRQRSSGGLGSSGGLSGGEIDPRGDHRIALAGAVAALAARGETRIRGAGCVAVSFPTFPELVTRLQAGG